jgi:hypothetical protein
MYVRFSWLNVVGVIHHACPIERHGTENLLARFFQLFGNDTDLRPFFCTQRTQVSFMLAQCHVATAKITLIWCQGDDPMIGRKDIVR